MNKMIGKIVVIDTTSTWIYVGTFAEEDEACVYLDEADAYDTAETTLSKHEYLLRIKNDGISVNRRRVAVLKARVVAVTIFDDIRM